MIDINRTAFELVDRMHHVRKTAGNKRFFVYWSPKHINDPPKFRVVRHHIGLGLKCYQEEPWRLVGVYDFPQINADMLRDDLAYFIQAEGERL